MTTTGELAPDSHSIVAIAEVSGPGEAQMVSTESADLDDPERLGSDAQPQDCTDDSQISPRDSSSHDTSSQPSPSRSPHVSSRSDTSDHSGSDEDLPMDRDIIRSLRIKGYSHEEGRWVTDYFSAQTPVHAVRVVTWNVDFMAPDSAGRIACILDHLRKVVLTKRPQPSCILLQELDHKSFAEILSNEWIREHFAITPSNTRRWPSSYGVATLVSRHLCVKNAQMLQFYRTTMGRTAVFVDIEMYLPGYSGERRTVRIANTHLESLPEGQRSRPAQLCAIADLLRDDKIDGGGIVGGDMNMIGPADRDIHKVAGLQDACTDPSAVTWGFQPPTRFPPGRLDRIFYTGEGLVVDPVQVIGKGLKTKRWGGQWASDHYGLVTTIQLASDSESTD